MKNAEEIFDEKWQGIPSHGDDGAKVIYEFDAIDAINEHSDQFKVLLKKYIAHVRDCEGVDFITTGHSTHSDVVFTKAEMDLLIQLSEKP